MSQISVTMTDTGRHWRAHDGPGGDTETPRDTPHGEGPRSSSRRGGGLAARRAEARRRVLCSNCAPHKHDTVPIAGFRERPLFGNRVFAADGVTVRSVGWARIQEDCVLLQGNWDTDSDAEGDRAKAQGLGGLHLRPALFCGES